MNLLERYVQERGPAPGRSLGVILFTEGCGFIVFTPDTPRIRRNFSIKSASFNKSS